VWIKCAADEDSKKEPPAKASSKPVCSDKPIV
jgi:hypothetical protein